ncbi:Kelch repeat-containing protein [Maribacter halichondriae]|uniref:Kelch repeat-containing protein n=1 Tax=Maribacter halichondriae TaxID=2980554 RepID=UPI0023598ECF|nr:hypothetical protein [Maribacter sp. Hal144]
MKSTYKICTLYLVFVIASCSSSDDSAPMVIALQNEPPLSFELTEVADGAKGVEVTPTLSWESAKNPKGSEVTYDLYLGTEVNPTTLFQGDINDTSFEIGDRLHLLTDYYWKVVAKDVDGKTSQSAIQKFSIRSLNIPEEPVTPIADFAPRSQHTSVVHDNRMWIIGGEDPVTENLISDVWYSSDGATWVEATKDAAFSDRILHTSAVFDNKIWVIGGQMVGEKKNDVWYSADGINWDEATDNASFSGRKGHSTLVYDNKMWVIGGKDANGFKNDVWYSSNGFEWQMATASAEFSVVSRHASVIFDDKMWVIGGEFESGGKRNEVWSSTDGVHWTQATKSAEFSERGWHAAAVFDNKIWIIGGLGNQGEAPFENEVWYSHDGTHWAQAPVSGLFLERRPPNTAVVHHNKIWVIGEEILTSSNSAKSEVWPLD